MYPILYIPNVGRILQKKNLKQRLTGNMMSWSHWSRMIRGFGFLVSRFGMFGCRVVFILQMVERQGRSIFLHVIPMHWESKYHFHTEWMSMEILSFVDKCGRRMVGFHGCGFMICGRWWKCGWVVGRIWWGIIRNWWGCIIISKVEDFFKSASIMRWGIPL